MSSQPRRSRLPSQPARTRFAPSPTGYLHLGSLRTALYNYLLARATNGQFILRLEDTDQSRIVPDAEQRLYEDLKWSGLTWDEGPDSGGPFGPYKQSLRLHIYKEYADRLLREDKAFRCFCSHDDMAAHNRMSLKVDGTFGGYPGKCLSIPPDEAAERAAKGETHTIRFKSSSTPPAVHDIVYGLYRKKLPEDHFIIMKSDGFPTYHFANVVDDHLMKITHVIRGAEWLISTAKHVSLYDAFGWEPPKFAHVGLLVDSKRQKLSKRNMDIGIDTYKQAGIPPPALLNFAALLGWNPNTLQNKGVMTLDEMVAEFGLKFTKGDIVVNMEKLGFFHKKHIRLAIDSLPSESCLIDDLLVGPILRKAQSIERQRQELQEGVGENSLALLENPLISFQEADKETARRQIQSILKMSRNDCITADDVLEANKFLVWQPSTQHIHNSFQRLPATDESKNDVAISAANTVRLFIRAMEQIEESRWTFDEIQAKLHEAVDTATHQENEQLTTTVVYKYLRWALLGLVHGPQITPLMQFLGREETLRRFRVAESVAVSATDN